MSRDREDWRATGQPQGVGSEAYLYGTSQDPTPEDARKDGHILGRSSQLVKYPGSTGTRPASCVLSVFPDLPTRALGSLQGIELHYFLGSRLDVGSEIAGAVFPLDLGVGAGLAIGAL